MSTTASENVFAALEKHAFDDRLPARTTMIAAADPSAANLLLAELYAGRSVVLVHEKGNRLIEPSPRPLPLRLVDVAMRTLKTSPRTLRVRVHDIDDPTPVEMFGQVTRPRATVMRSSDVNTLVHCG